MKWIFIIILAGLALYFPSFENGFVGDDQSQVIDNPSLHSIANLPDFFSASTFDNGGQLTGIYYKPLMSSFYSLIYTFFGPNPLAYHVFSLLIHLLNCILVFLVLRYFLSEKISGFLALIFLVHPINSQSVLYISALQDLLFFFFGMLSLFTLQKIKSVNIALPLSTIFLLLSILSKETGVLFFPLLIFFKYLFDRKSIIIFTLCQMIVFGFYLFLRVHAIGWWDHGVPNSPIAALSFWQRLLNIPEIIVFYLKTFIFPLDLSLSWHWTVQKMSLLIYFFIPLIILIILTLLAIKIGLNLRSKNPKNFKQYLFFLAWLILGLGFHSQLLVLDTTVAERWFYFPMVGLLGLIGALLSRSKNIKIITVLTIIIVILFSYRTNVRERDFKNDLTLNTHDIAVSQDAFDLESSLSHTYTLQGNLTEAKKHAQRSVDLFPYITNLNNLGLIYAKEGDAKKAEELFNRSISIADFYMPYQNLSGLKLLYGDTKEAEGFTLKALGKFPNNARLWFYLALIENKLNQKDQAKFAIEKAYSLDPTEPILGVYQTLESNQPLNIQLSF